MERIASPSIARQGAASALDERARWRAWARDTLAAEDEWMILALETTGTGDAELIEFAAVTPSGATLVDRLIRPRGRIPRFITQLTGITDTMVAGAPAFAELFPDALLPHLASRGVLAYNVGFDVPMLRRNILRHFGRAWEPVEKACLMRAYANWRGEHYPVGHGHAGRVRVHRLEEACRQMGIAYAHGHRALHDCRVSALLLQAMARE